MIVNAQQARVLVKVLDGKPLGSLTPEERHTVTNLRAVYADLAKSESQRTFEQHIKDGLPFEEAIVQTVREHGPFPVPN